MIAAVVYALPPLTGPLQIGVSTASCRSSPTRPRRLPCWGSRASMQRVTCGAVAPSCCSWIGAHVVSVAAMGVVLLAFGETSRARRHGLPRHAVGSQPCCGARSASTARSPRSSGGTVAVGAQRPAGGGVQPIRARPDRDKTAHAGPSGGCGSCWWACSRECSRWRASLRRRTADDSTDQWVELPFVTNSVVMFAAWGCCARTRRAVHNNMPLVADRRRALPVGRGRAALPDPRGGSRPIFDGAVEDGSRASAVPCGMRSPRPVPSCRQGAWRRPQGLSVLGPGSHRALQSTADVLGAGEPSRSRRAGGRERRGLPRGNGRAHALDLPAALRHSGWPPCGPRPPLSQLEPNDRRASSSPTSSSRHRGRPSRRTCPGWSSASASSSSSPATTTTPTWRSSVGYRRTGCATRTSRKRASR